MLILTTQSSAKHGMNNSKVALHGDDCQNDYRGSVTDTLNEEIQLTDHLNMR